MGILRRHFYPVTLNDIAAFANKHKLIPKKSVAVTFDDGFADNFHTALPILDSFQIKATFYVTVGSIESTLPWFVRVRYALANTKKTVWLDPSSGFKWDLTVHLNRSNCFQEMCRQCAKITGDVQGSFISSIEKSLDVEPYSSEKLMMDWDQIRTLQQASHSIGSHTMTHPNLAHIGQELVRSEILESKLKLQKELAQDIVHFSYPSPILQPHWTPFTVSHTKDEGYVTATTCDPGPVKPGDNPLTLKRISVPKTRDEFLWALENTFIGRIV